MIFFFFFSRSTFHSKAWQLTCYLVADVINTAFLFKIELQILHYSPTIIFSTQSLLPLSILMYFKYKYIYKQLIIYINYSGKEGRLYLRLMSCDNTSSCSSVRAVDEVVSVENFKNFLLGVSSLPWTPGICTSQT